MKRLLIAAVLPVLLFACAKEDDVNPSFREPTCEDTTDDGMFEAFSLPEAEQFLRWYKDVPAQEVPDVVRYKYVSGHTLYNNGILYDPYFVYRINRPVQVFAYMPLKTQQQQYYSWVKTSVDSSRNDTLNIYNIRKLALQPGCYRVYYVFSDTDTGTVYTKGHYDFQVK